MNRTIKLQGVGFSETSAEIQVSVDGAVIYQGPVLSSQQPFHISYAIGSEQLVDPTTLDGLDAAAALYNVATWTENVNFSGTRNVEIVAIKDSFLLSKNSSNYMPVYRVEDPTTMFSSGEKGYISCYYQQESSGVFRDPNTNVTIDGIAQIRNTEEYPTKQLGQWAWGIQQGQTLAFTVNISAGLETPIYTDGDNILSSQSYTGDGVTTDFAKPTYTGNRPTFVKCYVDNVQVSAQTLPNQNVRFQSAPTLDSAVRVDVVERWDSSLLTYANFER